MRRARTASLTPRAFIDSIHCETFKLLGANELGFCDSIQLEASQPGSPELMKDQDEAGIEVHTVAKEGGHVEVYERHDLVRLPGELLAGWEGEIQAT